MSWTVVESFVEAKTEGRVCEDMIVATSDFAAVIDGASDATGADFGGITGGRLAAEAVASAIESLDAMSTAAQFADTVSRSLATRVEEQVGQLTGDTRWPAATVICLSFARNEVWRVGDGTVMIGDQIDTGSLSVNQATYPFRAAVNAALLASGTTREEILREDPGARAARSLIDIQQHLSNVAGPWGYGCINGRPVPDEFIEIFPIDASTGQVILASDGYPMVRPTLHETEQELHSLLAVDPLAIDELRVMSKTLRPDARSMDDRSYLRARRD